ncbi:MAG TPA: transposase, partial [Sedimentisphaerales bacterium]|nr:transposase [Sedimentisphaerales bacterium]
MKTCLSIQHEWLYLNAHSNYFIYPDFSPIFVATKKRRKKCGVPKHIRYQTRHELALDMLRNNGKYLPHAWIAGDDEMGRSSRFRRDLRDLEELYILAVPSNTGLRDLESDPPAYSGRGQPPK